MAKKTSSKSVQGYPLGKLQVYDPEWQQPQEKRDGVNVGLANGLKLTQFLNELFQRNYEAELSDPELEEALRKEFPNRENFQGIDAYRGYYNAGLHGFGQNEKLEGEYRLPRFFSEEEKQAKANAREERAAARRAEKEAAKKAEEKAAKAGKSGTKESPKAAAKGAKPAPKKK